MPVIQKSSALSLQLLFRSLIFNREYLKLWFNFQQDINVLDATIAHMYQATPRERFEELDWGTKQTYWIRPTWKIHSPRYQSPRPQDLCFPRFRGHVDSCELHENKVVPPGSRLNRKGLSCPCQSTGNVDITNIFEFISRQLGYNDGRPSSKNDKRQWHQVKPGCNYASLLKSTMQTDRLYEVFEYLKNAPERASRPDSSSTPKEQLDDWYQSLGPGMETDSDKMGYNIGDVAGVALLMRFLTTTDDRMLFVAALVNYWFCNDSDFGPAKQYPQQRPKLEAPRADSPNAYVYLNDYPKSFKRRMIGNDSFPFPGLLSRKVGDIFQGRDDNDRRLLSYFEHDTRAEAARRSFKRAKKLYGGEGPTFPHVTKAALDAVRAEIFDPLDYSLPRWFTYQAKDPKQGVSGRLPLIRAGVTPYEDLLTLIQDIKKDDPDAEIHLPTTGDEGETNWYGLPRYIRRKPAGYSSTLPDTRRPLSPVPPPPLKPMTAKAESRLSPIRRRRREDLRALHRDWDNERDNEQLVVDTTPKAAQTRFDDIFDPRGRKYRSDWDKTNDGEFWESPPPPGTAPDEELPETEPASPLPASDNQSEHSVDTSGWENPAPPDRKPSNGSGWGLDESCYSKHARFEGDGLGGSDFLDDQSPELDSRPSKRARLGFYF